LSPGPFTAEMGSNARNLQQQARATARVRVSVPSTNGTSDRSGLLSPGQNYSQSGHGNNSTAVDFSGADLLSPIASTGRPSVGSAVSASSISSQRKVPTPAIPVANEIGGKLYPDLRNHFIKALISHAKMARRAVHTKKALDGSIRAINGLALYPYPIRSAEAASCIDGIGTELISVLKESQNAIKKDAPPYNPPNGRFSSAAAAALVVLLDHENGASGEERFCSMENLIEKVNEIAHCTSGGRLFNRDIEYYLDKKTADPGLMQVSSVQQFARENIAP